MRIRTARICGLSFVGSTSWSALVKLVVEEVVELGSGASKESSWGDVCDSAGDDAAGVVGKGIVPLWVEALLEAQQVADEFGDRVFVVFVSEVHAPVADDVFEVADAERFGVMDRVGVVADGSAFISGGFSVGAPPAADEDVLAVEALPHAVSMMRWSGATVTTNALLIWLRSR